MYDFLVLFALIGAIGLIVSWRSGSFISSAAVTRVDPRRQAPAHAQAPAPKMQPASKTSTLVRHTPVAMLPAPEPLPASPEVLAAALETAIVQARKVLPDHWSTVAIARRPGWMIFEPSDFLGTSGVEMTYEIPKQSQPGVLELHPIELVRAIELGANVVAISRRKVIQSRWDARARRRAGASAHAVAALKRAV